MIILSALGDRAGESSAAAAAWATFAVAALALVAATVTALLSWRTSRSLTQVERDRWHRELTPAIRVILTHWGPGSDAVRMRLRLDGPVGLDHLDSVEVSIRDTPGDRVSNLVGSPSVAELAQVIWGPLRFRPNVDGTEEPGRAVPGVPLTVGEERTYLLEPSMHPKWITDPTPAVWEQAYGTEYRRTLRLAIRCTKTGFKPWFLPVEVEFD